LWGFARLAHARPAMTAGCGEILSPFLASAETAARGLAAWACMPVEDVRLMPRLESLIKDRASFMLYREDRLESCTVGELAEDALRRIREVT